MTRSADPPDLLLLSMPFGPLRQPSLGLSLLEASLPEQRVAIRYETLSYARRIGWRGYLGICGRRYQDISQVGEWIMSAGLTEPDDDDSAAEEVADEERFLDRLAAELPASSPLGDDERRWLSAMRREVPGYLDELAGEIVALAPRIVGFTSVFQQHAASLALARRLRRRADAAGRPLPILLGGANCEGVMGLETVRSFPFVDAVVSGEAELIVGQLIDRLLADPEGSDGAIDELPGVFTRRNLDRHDPDHPDGAPRLPDLDQLPVPDFSEFFAQWHTFIEDPASERAPGYEVSGPATGGPATGGPATGGPATGTNADPADRPAPRLLFETSRGCWWGAKQHCTFCGLNGTSMAFRSKSAERALAELTALTAAHPGRPVLVVDNILDMRYLRDFVPALAGADLGVELFYEVKANLKKEQLASLRDAGIREIQPGIESLSDSVLTLMRKGVSGLQNIQLLKWCREIGVSPSWHLIWGFPGEPPDEYRRMAELLPLLAHLPPPAAACPIRLHRFSPNFEQAEQLGFTGVEPVAAYRHIYRHLPAAARHNLAYYFDYRYTEERDVPAYTAALGEQVATWRQSFAGSELLQAERGDQLVLWDLRPAARRPMTRLTGPAKALYQACDSIRTRPWLREHLGNGQPLSEEQLDDLAGPLVEDGLMLREGERLLSLAVAGGGGRG